MRRRRLEPVRVWRLAVGVAIVSAVVLAARLSFAEIHPVGSAAACWKNQPYTGRTG